MRIGLQVCAIGLVFVGAVAAANDPLHRESPRSSVYAFLEACHAKNYQQAWHYIDFRSAPAAERSKSGPQVAQELELVLDREVRFDVAGLSADAEGDRGDGLEANRERVETFTLDGKEVGLDMQRVTLRSGISVWVFSADSIPLIPQLAKQATSSPIERHLPAVLVDHRLLDTPIWSWIALALTVLVTGVLSRLLVRPVILLVESLAGRFMPRVSRAAMEAFAGPLRLLLLVGVFRAVMEWVEPSALMRLYVGRAVSVVLFAGLAWLCMVVVDVVMRRMRVALEDRHRHFSYSALPMASRFVKILIGLFMIAAILSSWGYNTSTILAGLGVGGLAIALAAQKTIENLFGGIAVITDQPVAVGDVCKFGNLLGTVEDVGLRSTRIRTLDRTLVTVPNGEFSTMTLENFSRRDKMWFHITLNLRRDAQPAQVRGLLDSITGMLREHAKVETGPVPVRFVGIGTYSLDLEVFAYVMTKSGDEFLTIQQELLLSILDAVARAGTALAVPTQAWLPMGGPSAGELAAMANGD